MEKENLVLRSPKKLRPLLLLTFGLLLVGFLIYLFSSFGSSLNLKDLTSFVKKDVLEKPEGQIYLTLASFNTLHSTLDAPSLDIYRLDLSSSDSNNLDLFFQESPDVLDNLMANFSQDGSKMTFVRRYSDYLSQVLVLDLETEELMEVSPRYALLERNPVFSPDSTNVAYWVYESSENPFGHGNSPEDHFIVMSAVGDPYLIERIKANGVYPIFSPDGGYLLFLKNDGLYTLDLMTDIERLVMELDMELEEEHFGLPSWLSWRFNISPDGKFLIITNSLSARVSLFKINSWEDFDYEEVFKETFVNTPIWPVFSPSSDYFALQTGNEIKIFDLEGSEVENVFDLVGYNTESVWLSDWIIEK